MTTTSRPPLACKTCGDTDVWFRQTRAGKWYLAVILPPTPDFGHSTRIARPHICPSAEQVERQARVDAAITAQIEERMHFENIRNAHLAGEHNNQPDDDCIRCLQEGNTR